MPGETPKTRNYAQPRSDRFGNIYRDADAYFGTDSRIPFLGPLDQGFMGRSPQLSGLYAPDAEVTPANANPAAVRAYTRNAPYLEEFISDPQAMLREMYELQKQLKREPDDVVSQAKMRIFRQAMSDVFGMKAPDEIYGYGLSRPEVPTTPSYIGDEYGTTPRSPPTMPQTMARRGR